MITRPDGKSRVTVEYEDGKPIRIDSIVISTQHNEQVKKKNFTALSGRGYVKTLPKELIDEKQRSTLLEDLSWRSKVIPV